MENKASMKRVIFKASGLVVNPGEDPEEVKRKFEEKLKNKENKHG